MIWVLGLIAGLVALYMAQPRFRRFRLSSARFFRELPAPRERRFRFSVSRPETGRLFWMQMLALLLLLLAFVLRHRLYQARADADGQGVWVLVDTSASMSTEQDGKPRHEAVAETIELAVEEGGETDRRFRLSLFDLEVRDVALSEPSLRAVLNRDGDWTPRPLGTDLARLRALPEPQGFAVTHLLVITDRPAPDWLAEVEKPRIVWRDLSRPVENLGIASIQGGRNPLTGRVSTLRVGIEAHGAAASPVGVVLAVTGPDGQRVDRAVSTWARHERSFTSELELAVEDPGTYAFELGPGGAYAFDDEARVEVPAAGELRVDWQLPDRRIPDTLGWIQDPGEPAFRVQAADAELTPAATLLVAGGPDLPPAEILDFQEGHALLRDVNLDAVEQLALPAAELPAGLRPVLRRTDDRAWLAEGELDPESGPRLLVCALPTLSFDPRDSREAFALTTFFNATRALLAGRPSEPLYTLTTPAEPEPRGTRLTLHPGEGDTASDPRSQGGLGAAGEIDLPEEKRPLWPAVLAFAVVVLACERGLAAWGGPKWK